MSTLQPEDTWGKSPPAGLPESRLLEWSPSCGLLHGALDVLRGLGLGSRPGALRSCLRKQLRIRERGDHLQLERDVGRAGLIGGSPERSHVRRRAWGLVPCSVLLLPS